MGQIPLLKRDQSVSGYNIYEVISHGNSIGWVNPLNKERGKVVYTKQNPANVDNFNSIPTGGGDTIFQNGIALHQGNINR
ncbi:hypothetical protein GCM10023149_21580 [Mucilaginibacter gynuensis]|uniref:Uncharacterized protein n=1 Tax=Mucilaginibacter gynuensis TaxID=1302236 RepID=A0ABP8GCQ9_9SPHI